MTKQGQDYRTRMEQMLSQVQAAVETARQAKDVIRLNCLLDKQAQLKANGTPNKITNPGTGSSPITISGCTGNASAASTVEVHIVHTFIGDLVVDLIAPDGTVYNLWNRQGGSADNINQTFTVNLSSEGTNGTWTLRASDRAAIDSGRIDSWTLDL